jgi:hypothetical protein
VSVPARCSDVIEVASLEAVTRGILRYADPDPQRFFLATDGRDAQTRWRGSSFACPVVTGIAARYLCARNPAAPCAGPGTDPPGTSPADAVLARLRASADRGFPSYVAGMHGQGVARYLR